MNVGRMFVFPGLWPRCPKSQARNRVADAEARASPGQHCEADLLSATSITLVTLSPTLVIYL